MTKAEFDELFDRAVKESIPQTKEEILASMTSYAKDPSHITMNEIIAYVQVESVAYTNKLVYAVLSELFIKD